MLAVTVNGEALPDKSGTGYDVICKEEQFDSKAFLRNVIFENYNQNYTESNLANCQSNVVFKPHPTASDITGSHHLHNTTCNNCTNNSMAFFTKPDPKNFGWDGGCGNFLCTGKNNYLIHDWDGAFLGSPGILIPNNSQIGNNEPECTFIQEINGHHCTTQDFGVLEYESIAPDFNTRIMWPVYLKYDGGSL